MWYYVMYFEKKGKKKKSFTIFQASHFFLKVFLFSYVFHRGTISQWIKTIRLLCSLLNHVYSHPESWLQWNAPCDQEGQYISPEKVQSLKRGKKWKGGGGSNGFWCVMRTRNIAKPNSARLLGDIVKGKSTSLIFLKVCGPWSCL